VATGQTGQARGEAPHGTAPHGSTAQHSAAQRSLGNGCEGLPASASATQRGCDSPGCGWGHNSQHALIRFTRPPTCFDSCSRSPYLGTGHAYARGPIASQPDGCAVSAVPIVSSHLTLPSPKKSPTPPTRPRARCPLSLLCVRCCSTHAYEERESDAVSRTSQPLRRAAAPSLHHHSSSRLVSEPGNDNDTDRDSSSAANRDPPDPSTCFAHLHCRSCCVAPSSSLLPRPRTAPPAAARARAHNHLHLLLHLHLHLANVACSLVALLVRALVPSHQPISAVAVGSSGSCSPVFARP
jgi:hypothetical protein